MCSVIWSMLQKSHLTQICLVTWWLSSSSFANVWSPSSSFAIQKPTANSNISVAKPRQPVSTLQMQVTPSLRVGQGQSEIDPWIANELRRTFWYLFFKFLTQDILTEKPENICTSLLCVDGSWLQATPTFTGSRSVWPGLWLPTVLLANSAN